MLLVLELELEPGCALVQGLVLQLLVLERVLELVLEPDGQITGNTSTRGGGTDEHVGF